MSKLKKERLNQMIENALSYKQEEVKLINSRNVSQSLKYLILKPKAYGLTFASLILSFVFINPIVTSRNFVDVNEINDYVTYRIIEDL